MLTLTIIYGIIFIVSMGWIASLTHINNELREQLNNQQLNPTTPLKELAAEFRSFVEGVDGRISPEVDLALKQLETREVPKQEDATNIRPKNKCGKLLMGKKEYDLFWAEWKTIGVLNDDKSGRIVHDDGEETIQLVKSWGKGYIYSKQQQVDILARLNIPEARKQLRDYFDSKEQQ